jgi:hypothetical protein
MIFENFITTPWFVDPEYDFGAFHSAYIRGRKFLKLIRFSRAKVPPMSFWGGSRRVSEFKAFLEKCEALVREGRGREATLGLKRVKSVASVPRGDKLGYANLCRRTGLISRGLRALHPVVRPQRAVGEPASAQETAEYAALLQRAGATPEALLILNGLETRATPQVLLFRAFCHFNRWDYEAAEPNLREYLGLALTPYEKTVGQINLASALLVNGKWKEAGALLDELIAAALAQNYGRVAANALEMRAQARLSAGEFAAARADLNQAEELLRAESAQDVQFVHKWNAVGEALENGNLGKLLAYRARNVRQGIWENVREADLYLLRAKFHPRRFEHLYFGTPFAGYRARILRTLKTEVPAARYYLFGPGRGAVVDAESAGPTPKIQAAVSLLVSDFYRPYSAAGIFSELYPGEFYNVETSPNRVRRLLGRTAAHFRGQGWPLAVVQRAGRFHLKFLGPLRFLVPRDPSMRDANELRLARLSSQFGTADWFRTQDMREALAMSPSAFKRFAGWARAHDKMERSGATHATYYRIKKPGSAA